MSVFYFFVLKPCLCGILLLPRAIYKEIKMKSAIYRMLSATLVSVIIIYAMGMCVSAAAYECWYIKRNGNNRPSFPASAENMREYNCYFIDDNLDDSNKRIYITFDAGYENGNVEKILDILKEENVPAAFFVLDNIILKNTDLVRRMSDEGHLVCNHTKNHKNLSSAGRETISADLSALEDIYRSKTGKEMSKYFRFPEGKYSIDALKCIYELGYKTIFWSFAYDDWDNSRQMSSERAIDKVMANTHNGAVMLFHPTSTTNVKIFSTLIQRWRDEGYEFGTLDELTK